MQLQNFVIFRLSCTTINLSCQKFKRLSLRANAEQVALSGVHWTLVQYYFATHPSTMMKKSSPPSPCLMMTVSSSNVAGTRESAMVILSQ